MLGVTRLSSKFIENSSPNDWPNSLCNFRAIDELLRCKICQDFITLAEMLQHCSHTFCSSCIHHWLSFQNSCPSCGIEAKETHLAYNRIVDEILKHFHRIKFSLLGPADKENDPTLIENKQKLELKSPENKMCRNNFAKLKSPSLLIINKLSSRIGEEECINHRLAQVKSEASLNHNKQKSVKHCSPRMSNELKALGVSPLFGETKSPVHQNLRKRLHDVRNISQCASDSKARSHEKHDEHYGKRISLTCSHSSKKLSLKRKSTNLFKTQSEKRESSISCQGSKEVPIDKIQRRSKRLSLKSNSINVEVSGHEKTEINVLSEDAIQLANQVRGKRKISKENKLLRLAEINSLNPEKLSDNKPDGQSVLRLHTKGNSTERDFAGAKERHLMQKTGEYVSEIDSGKKARTGCKLDRKRKNHDQILEKTEERISETSSFSHDMVKVTKKDVLERYGDIRHMVDIQEGGKLIENSHINDLSTFSVKHGVVDTWSDRDTPDLLEETSVLVGQTQPQLEYKVMSDELQYKQDCKKYLGDEISTNIITFKQSSEVFTGDNEVLNDGKLEGSIPLSTHDEFEEANPDSGLETSRDTSQGRSSEITGTSATDRYNDSTPVPQVVIRSFDSPSPIVKVDRYLERVGDSRSGSLTPTDSGYCSNPFVCQSSARAHFVKSKSVKSKSIDGEATNMVDSDTEDVLKEVNKSIAEFDAEALFDTSFVNNSLISDYQDIWPALSLITSTSTQLVTSSASGRLRRESELSESGSDLSCSSEMSYVIPLSQEFQSSQKCDMENECPSELSQEKGFVKKTFTTRDARKTRSVSRPKRCKRLRSFSLEKRASKRMKTTQ